MPVYAAAIAEAGLRRGGVAVDAGCGTGRALPALRDAVGPGGTVIALELTPEMLARARAKGWATLAARHGRTISPDEILSPAPLRRATAATGWDLAAHDDGPDRFLALAIRQLPGCARYGACGSPSGAGSPAPPDGGSPAPPDGSLPRPGPTATTRCPSCVAASP